MVNEYGTDDVDYLLSVTEKKDCLTIHRDGKAYFVKIGRFDNREDKTTPFRKPQAQWKPEEVESMKAGMIAAFDAMLKWFLYIIFIYKHYFICIYPLQCIHR